MTRQNQENKPNRKQNIKQTNKKKRTFGNKKNNI